MGKVILIIVLSLLGAVLYRLGGSAKKGDWLDAMRHTKARDFGVPAIVVLELSLLGAFHWSLILCFGALFGALTTYNKWFGRLFGFPKGDVYWPSWGMTGFLYALSMLPYAIGTGHYLGFGLRCALLSALVVIWSEALEIDWLEEGARGFLIVVTAPLLLI